MPLPKLQTAPTSPLPLAESNPFSLIDFIRIFKFCHMKALICKHFLEIRRNVAAMSFILGLPCFQIIMFFLAIGHDPKGLKLAVSNHELNTTDNCPIINGCKHTLLSCRFLDILKQRDMVIVSIEFFFMKLF